MPPALRLDAAMVTRGLSVSRTAARKAIESGRVSVRRTGHPEFLTVAKPAFELHDADEVRLENAQQDRWVSRGALKLLGALHATGINPAGLAALDVGQSTGGFTDALLDQGVERVLGIDVGHGQLHPRLQKDPRVACIEGCNARDLDLQRLNRLVSEQIAPGTSCDWIPSKGYDLIVADVSFISLLKVSTGMKTLMAADGHGLWLVKPQFEVGPGQIGKGGIVKADALGEQFEMTICEALRKQGFQIRQFMPSPIAGGDGNREFFVWVNPES